MGGGIMRKGKGGVVRRREAAATRRTSLITVVGMKEANHFRTNENVYYFTIIHKNWTKSKIGDRQGVKNLIRDALTIADFPIDKI